MTANQVVVSHDGAAWRWQEFTGERAIHVESGKTFDEIAQERIV